MLTSHEIRNGFIEFFKDRGHTFVPSAPVIPLADPTLLFINAGMNQFKDIFLGLRTPAYTRVVNSQKCIRVSGKHNDLEEVGPSNRHHTFFEMLGNWSFGDYYKQDAIKWAWELLTEVWKLPKARLYATVYLDDDEAEAIWKSETDINPAHISRHGKKDNFWEMGEIGPCGPCSEIHIDMGPDACDMQGVDHVCEVNGVCGRILEIWNLVFIQYHRDENGKLHDLPAKHVDTGAGLERISAVLQGGLSNYDSDLFKPLIAAVEDLSGVPYGGDIIYPHRIIADHLRSLTFAIADGALPANEGRGYVLRRILRRASRYGHEIGLKEPFIYKLVPVLIDLMGGVYPEIKEKHQHVTLTIKSEEEGFTATLERGLDIFNGMTGRMAEKSENILTGDCAFKLYDTFGFPLDLTQLMAREKGFGVDVEGFHSAMSRQKERARAGGKFVMNKNDKPPYINITDYAEKPSEEWQTFTGYKEDSGDTEIVKYRPVEEGIEVVVKETPFYAEAGGQAGDTGTMTLQTKKYPVTDSYIDEASQKTLKIEAEFEEFRENLKSGSEVKLEVDIERRWDIRRNHTATHLLQHALRQILGEHVQQSGSYVHPDYLRFDYTHYQKPDSGQLFRVEQLVNENIMANYPVMAEITSIEEARKQGAMALFGEKYGEEVRMISVGDISRELCGGTHCNRSGDVGNFRITSETGVSSGIRRIEAKTGNAAIKLMMEDRQALEDIREILHSHGSDVVEKLQKFAADKKELEKEVEKLRKSGGGIDLKGVIGEAVEISGVKVVTKVMEVKNLDELKDFGDLIRDNLQSGLAFLAADLDGKAGLVCVVTDDLIAKGIKAGDLVKKAAKVIGGGGGGRPHLATAGAKSSENLDKALEEAVKIAKEALK